MSKLGDEIAAMIAQEGPITLERYMSLCLSHPTLGYYMTRDPFGRGGDFITAPEISQMFGELLGLWIIEAWMAAGAPENAVLVELGPGRGTLMSDMLRAARVAPAFLKCARVLLVETSPTLRETQRATLAAAPLPIGWASDIAAAPENAPLFIVANEFFDALPVRHFVKSRDGWRERLVGLDNAGSLAFGLSGEIESRLTLAAPEGAIVEVASFGQRVMSEIAARIARQGGALLAIDYGYRDSSFGETLQAMQNHAYVDPLAEPGEADLTTHVDFGALARAARDSGAGAFGPVTQRELLLRLGLEQRAAALSRKASEAQRAEIEAARERLAGVGDARTAMGELFKALAVLPKGAPTPAAFES
jgi:NADH dehydrogenase [ubiquinone] 1 alpha subcomplex assembly factor 7